MPHFEPETAAPSSSRTVSASAEPGPLPDTWTITFNSQAVPGTLAVFAGTLSASGLDIISALVRLGADGTVSDSFDVAPLDGIAFGPGDVNRLERLAEQTLNGRHDLAAELRRARHAHAAAPDVEPRVEINVDSELTTGVSVVCADRPGLLYDIASTLSRHHLRTRSLSVLTFNRRAYDTFRVIDGTGAAPDEPGLLARLRAELLLVCSQ